MPNNFKLCPTYYSTGGEKCCREGFAPFASLGYGPGRNAVPTPNIKED